MTEGQRQQIFDALLGPVPDSMSPDLRQEFAEMVAADVARIEPLIDQFLEDARASLLCALGRTPQKRCVKADF